MNGSTYFHFELTNEDFLGEQTVVKLQQWSN